MRLEVTAQHERVYGSLEEHPAKNGEARTRHPETGEDGARVVEDALNYTVVLRGHNSRNYLRWAFR